MTVDQPKPKEMTPEVMAHIALDTLKIRDASWDENQLVDRAGGQYSKDWHQSTEEACQKHGVDKRFVDPIYLGLSSWVNDFEAWAEETLGLGKPEPPIQGAEEPITGADIRD